MRYSTPAPPLNQSRADLNRVEVQQGQQPENRIRAHARARAYKVNPTCAILFHLCCPKLSPVPTGSCQGSVVSLRRGGRRE